MSSSSQGLECLLTTNISVDDDQSASGSGTSHDDDEVEDDDVNMDEPHGSKAQANDMSAFKMEDYDNEESTGVGTYIGLRQKGPRAGAECF